MTEELDEETAKQAELMSKSPGLTIVAYIPKEGKKPSLAGHMLSVDEMKKQGFYKKKRVLAYFVDGKKV
jgi:hypothetical protein